MQSQDTVVDPEPDPWENPPDRALCLGPEEAELKFCLWIGWGYLLKLKGEENETLTRDSKTHSPLCRAVQTDC